MTQITREFDEPFSEATAALPGSFSPSVVGIAGVPYLMDTASGAYKRESFDVVQQRNTTDARDVLLLPQDVWRQQAQSWHQGMGQSNQDRDDSLPYRYEESFGIDPWTKWQISLLPATQKMASYADKVWLTTYADYLAVISDSRIDWFDNVSASVSIGSTAVNPGNAVIDIANLGAYVTTLHSDGKVYETAGPLATPVLKGTYANANFIAYEKDYLLAGKGNKLYDISGGGSGTLIYTSPLPDFRWQSSTGGNSCIYILGGSGDKYVVHRVNIKQDGTGLQPCIVAATLPDGEIGYSIDQYLGFVLIGTNRGVRVAQENNANGDLTLGPLIPTTAAVRCFEGQDRFIWFGMSEMDSTYGGTGAGDDEADFFPQGTVCGLGRIDLSTTTTTALSPAYAADICALSVSGKDVRAVVTYQGKRVFAIDGDGVWAETANLMEGGWLKQGTMSFSVEDVKTGLYMQTKWMPLNGEVDIDVAHDSTGYTRIAEYKIANSIRSGNTSMNGTQFSRIEPRFVLKRSLTDSTAGPIVTRWEIRAVPVRGRTSRWTLPIMNYEELEIDMVKYTRDPLAVLETLISLTETGKLFVLQEAGRSYQVHAKEFDWRPEKLTVNGRAWQGVLTLVVEEVQ